MAERVTINCNSGILCFRVIESRNSSYPIGLVIVGKFGWQSHTIARGQDFRCLSEEILNEFPLSVHLGVLGHSG